MKSGVNPGLLNQERESRVFMGQGEGRMLQKPISSNIQVGKHVLHTVSAMTRELSHVHYNVKKLHCKP